MFLDDLHLIYYVTSPSAESAEMYTSEKKWSFKFMVKTYSKKIVKLT